MLRRLVFAGGFMLATATCPQFRIMGGELVELCHHPPGNPDNHQMIVVGEAAVPAHLAHGDHLHSMCPGHDE